jgi:aspartate racemase
MRTIGLIGGMSWESSIEYYRLVNEAARHRLGGLHNARSVMVTVDFAEIERMQHAGKWDDAGDALNRAARQLEAGGADFVVLCTNTMHKVAERMMQGVSIPLLHIADATARRITAAGIQKIALLGTAYTMEQDFYKGRLREAFGLEVLIPDDADRAVIHRVIYDELCLGVISAESKRAYLDVISRLAAHGAQGVIAGCTEITLLVKQTDISLPYFDTTAIHAEEAVAMALTDDVAVRAPYDCKRFRSVSNTPNGQVSGDTQFDYRQTDDVVWATYSGGAIRSGTLTGVVRQDGKLDFRYAHVDARGAIMTGVCVSTPETLADGRVRLHERWRWTSGDQSEGESIVEEIRD